MKETFEMITKNLRNLGIEGNIVFTGSSVLKLYQLLDRDITDIDIILKDTEKNRHMIMSLKGIFGTEESKYQKDNHVTLYFSNDNLHLDIFLDNSKVEAFWIGNYYTATPKHILKKKLSYNREKDKKDYQEIMLNALDIIVDNAFE